MRKLQNVFAATFALSLGFSSLGGCSALSKSSNAVVASEEDVSSVGLYVFDGTRVKAEDNSILKRFYDRAVVQSKGYFEGTDLFATNVSDPGMDAQGAEETSNIIQIGLNQICSDVKKYKLKYVFLAGYSRGAIEALTVVDRAKTYCGVPIPVRWVGLVDAVNTAIETLPAQMPAAGEITCLHVYKTPAWEHVLTTKPIPFCEFKKKLSYVHHTDFVNNEETLTALLESATQSSRGTLTFSDKPAHALSETIRVKESGTRDHTEAVGRQHEVSNPSVPVSKSASDLGGTLPAAIAQNAPVAQPAKGTAEVCTAQDSGIKCLAAGCSWDLTSGICSVLNPR